MQIADYVNALPDVYKKQSTSNNYKLLSIERTSVEGLRSDIEEVDATLDIYTATGKTLDLYGEMYRQPRGGMTDEQYRYIILQRVMRCLVGGDTNSVIEALASAFGTSPTEFALTESETPCTVEVVGLPYTILQSAGLTPEQMLAIVKEMLPCGVRLMPIELTGTFEFGGASDYDESKGFADLEQTIGGYFGHLADSDVDVPM